MQCSSLALGVVCVKLGLVVVVDGYGGGGVTLTGLLPLYNQLHHCLLQLHLVGWSGGVWCGRVELYGVVEWRCMVWWTGVTEWRCMVW